MNTEENIWRHSLDNEFDRDFWWKNRGKWDGKHNMVFNRTRNDRKRDVLTIYPFTKRGKHDN